MGKSGFAFEGSGRIDRIDRFTTKKNTEIITLVIQVEGQYPQLVPIKFFGRVAGAAADFSAGDAVAITGRLGGRDWNGKVYGEIVGETVEAISSGGSAGQHREVNARDEPPPPSDDDLPF